MKTLRPIYDFDSYSQPVEKELYAYFYQLIFAPIFQILEDKDQKLNALTSALKDSLIKGKITYSAPYFTGSFTAAISKELKKAGAVYNKQRRAYKLEPSSLPFDIIQAVADGNRIQKEKVKKVQDYLEATEGRQLPPLNLEPQFGQTIAKLDKQFHSSTRPLTGKEFEVPLEPNLKDQLKEAYSKNLDLYIKDWYETQILRLRKKVSENVSQGFRAESLIESIQQEKNVTYNKAKFLAKQETSLMVSKYRQIRYEEVGIEKYKWSTSHDARVRHDHAELQGKIFSFNNPPVTNHHTMARNNPGEDFGCRCVAIPIIPTKEVLRKELANV